MGIPWFVTRRLALFAPYAVRGFAAPFNNYGLRRGHRIFEEFAREVRARYARNGFRIGPAGEGGALLNSFDDLASKDFDPNAVHPLIRDLYERTEEFELRFQIRWNPCIRPFGFIYYHTLSRWFDQLRFPPYDSAGFEPMDGDLGLVDLDRDGRPEYRSWVRSVRTSGNTFYVGAIYTYRSSDRRGSPDAHLCIAFPIGPFNLTAVLKPSNHGDEFHFGSWGEHSLDAGTYLIWPGREGEIAGGSNDDDGRPTGGSKIFSMVPGLGLGEHFRFWVDRSRPDTIQVEHRETLLGVRAFTVRYEIARKQP